MTGVLVLQSAEKTNFVLALREPRYTVMVLHSGANGIHKIVPKIRTVLSTPETAQSSPMEMMWNAPIHQVGELTHASVTQVEVAINYPHFLKYTNFL